MPSTVIIFVKYPTPGTVKTRLAKTSGDAAATEFYRTCAEHVVQIASRTPNAGCIVACPPVNDGSTRDCGVNGVQKWLNPIAAEATEFAEQAQDKDLGVRMYQALHGALQAGSSKAVLIGSDIPDIRESILDAAFAALDNCEVVFGPAIDGGFYLVGASRLHSVMFQGIAWSTSNVLSESISQAASVGLNVAPCSTLPVLRDIDTIEDLQEWLDGLHDQTHQVRKISEKILATRTDV